ncbi:HipA N-terminal domain-containing protein [Desulfobacter latus]|uniref:HipA N-terminal domain-containing protein n=1 Tax=Desulfobacter latus TaxID=2292 RepID=A0A850T342_9BACT|nr:HipA N-terminal domain-containing protein [Desulfobacter latus]NWH06780.1 HipA N-terminal domain-containing protein [Desulfobacter latus]
MDRVGFVYFHHVFAGTLKQDKTGYSFIYDPAYITRGTPVSFNLPLQASPYTADELFPFFENLVSEGWLRDIQSRTQKIDENDRFALLLENGGDLVGAVRVLKDKG